MDRFSVKKLAITPIHLLEKKPRRIMVLGQEISICYRKKVPDGNTGHLLADPLRIMIRSDLENWRDILNHEIRHAILWITGLDQKMTREQEEAIVKAMEHGDRSILLIEN